MKDLLSTLGAVVNNHPFVSQRGGERISGADGEGGEGRGGQHAGQANAAQQACAVKTTAR